MELREEQPSSTATNSSDSAPDLAVQGASTPPHTRGDTDPNCMGDQASEIDPRDIDSSVFSDSGGNVVVELVPQYEDLSIISDLDDDFIPQNAEKGRGEESSSIMSASALPESEMGECQNAVESSHSGHLAGYECSVPVNGDNFYAQFQEDQHLSQSSDSTYYYRNQFCCAEQGSGMIGTEYHFSENDSGNILVSGTAATFPLQETNDAACVGELVSETSCECNVRMNVGNGRNQPSPLGMSQSAEAEPFSISAISHDDFEAYEEEPEAVGSRTVLQNDTDCGDSKGYQQEQTQSVLGPPSPVSDRYDTPGQKDDIAVSVKTETLMYDEPAVPELSGITENASSEELYVPKSISTEGILCEEPNTQTEQLAIISVTSQGTVLPTNDVVSFSPSTDFGTPSLPVSESEATDCAAPFHIVSVQTLSGLPPCAYGDETPDHIPTTSTEDRLPMTSTEDGIPMTSTEDGIPVTSTEGRISMTSTEDGTPTTVSIIPSETSQGPPESTVAESGRSAAPAEIFASPNCEETLPDSSAAAEGPVIQSVHTLSLDQMKTVDQDSNPIIPDLDTSSVIIKEEPIYTGYEQVKTDSEPGPPVSVNNQGTQAAQAIKGPNTADTVTKKGKKRVKITVIKGEWRRPKNKNKNKTVNDNAGQDTRQNAITVSPVPPPRATVRSEAANSAFPTALFRNAHMIKTEPVDEDYPDSNFSISSMQAAVPLSESSTNSQQIIRSSRTNSQLAAVPSSGRPASSKQTLEPAVPSTSMTVSAKQAAVPSSRRRISSQQAPAPPFPPVTEPSPGTSHVAAISTSLFSRKGSGRGKGRKRGPASLSSGSASDVTAPEQLETTSNNSAMESPVQSCAVRLKQLPSHIVAAGMVNVKTEPQVMQMSHSRVNGSLTHPAVFGPHIKVMDPHAFHPVKKRSKHGPRPWSCDLCDKTFKTASARSQHKKIHAGLKEHRCEFCEKTFTYKSTLTAHYRTHTDERPYMCSLCGAAFRWAGHLTNHMGTHSQVKMFKCDQCGKEFNQKANLMTHVKRHSGLRPHKCPECDIACITKTELASHMRKHSGVKPYKCHQCSASFAQNNTLQVHLRSHNDERPYQCHLCCSAFRQSTHRTVHIRLMHEKPQKEGYEPKKPRKPVNRGPKSVACAKKADQEPGAISAESASHEETTNKNRLLRIKTKSKKRKRVSGSDDDDDAEADPDWNESGVSRMKKKKYKPKACDQSHPQN